MGFWAAFASSVDCMAAIMYAARGIWQSTYLTCKTSEGGAATGVKASVSRLLGTNASGCTAPQPNQDTSLVPNQ